MGLKLESASESTDIGWVLLLSSVLVGLRSVQSLSHVQLLATPWTAACQASLSITNSQSPPKLMFIELVWDLWICIYEHVPRWFWCFCSGNHTMKTTLHSHGNFFCLYKRKVINYLSVFLHVLQIFMTILVNINLMFPLNYASIIFASSSLSD